MIYYIKNIGLVVSPVSTTGLDLMTYLLMNVEGFIFPSILSTASALAGMDPKDCKCPAHSSAAPPDLSEKITSLIDNHNCNDTASKI